MSKIKDFFILHDEINELLSKYDNRKIDCNIRLTNLHLVIRFPNDVNTAFIKDLDELIGKNGDIRASNCKGFVEVCYY